MVIPLIWFLLLQIFSGIPESTSTIPYQLHASSEGNQFDFVIPDYQNWLKTVPGGKIRASDSLRYMHRKNIVISNRLFENNRMSHLDISDCDTVIIRNCAFRNASNQAIDIFNCRVVRIENCFFENVVDGIRISRSRVIRVRKNQFLNMTGPPDQGVAIQLIECTGPSISINANYIVNQQGKSNPQDCINIFKSQGTAPSPITVDSNYINGGGPSDSGGGILLGDAGGSFQRARHNVLINPGQYGIAIYSAHHCEISDNVIYARQEAWTNAGILVYDGQKSGCSNHSVFGNRCWWINGTHAPGEHTEIYIPDSGDTACKEVTVGKNNLKDNSLNEQWDPPVTARIN